MHLSVVERGEIVKLRLTIGASEDNLCSILVPWADTEDSRLGKFVKDLEAKAVFARFS